MSGRACDRADGLNQVPSKLGLGRVAAPHAWLRRLGGPLGSRTHVIRLYNTWKMRAREVTVEVGQTCCRSAEWTDRCPSLVLGPGHKLPAKGSSMQSTEWLGHL